MSLILDEHREYLADQARLSAFRQAIEEVVTSGDVVLDLGAGTGIMGLLACDAGASCVYAIEAGAMIGLAREICRANGLQDRMRFIKGLSLRVELPERVDIVVADQIGRFGFEAGLLDDFRDARARFLKPGGVTIPSRVDLWVAPVEYPEMRDRVEFWNHSPAGFDFHPARDVAMNTGYPVNFCPEHLLGDAAVAASIDLARIPEPPLTLHASVVARRTGSLHGIGGWFSARLSDSVIMSNSPLSASSINRRQVFFPIDHPVALERGDLLCIEMDIIPSELIVTWKVEVREGANTPRGHAGNVCRQKARFIHSTFRGMLLCQEDLQRTQLHFIPRLSPWGEARRSILDLCDGVRALTEIEQEVYRRHAGLFASPDQAAAFVAEVVTRYSL